MSVIDEVKQKTDIVEVISQYTKLTKSGRTLRGLCPFHSEKHGSFFVYPDQQSWHCFGACSTGGDAFSFLMKKENIDFGEALRLLADRAGISLPEREPGDNIKKDERARLYQINEAAAAYFHDQLLNSPAAERARQYVAGRGLSLESITLFRLGYSPNSWEALQQHLKDQGYTPEEMLQAGLIVESEGRNPHDRFRNRLMFPIQNLQGKVTGFGARALGDEMPKYLNSPETPVFSKSGTLYAIHLAAAEIRKQDRVIIVEGYTDVITAHQHGFRNVIATMGTAVTETQLVTLKRLSRNITLALDADNAGEAAMLRCVDYENILDTEMRVIVMPEGQDPDGVIKESPELWPKLVGEAVPIVDFTFDMATAGLDLTTAHDRSLVVEKLATTIAAIKNPVRQAHYVQQLARLVNLPERTIEAAIKEITDSAPKRPRQAAAPTHPAAPILARPREEYCLALLLKHPGLKRLAVQPQPEYFQVSENRGIFIVLQETDDPAELGDKLDPALRLHLDYLLDYIEKRAVPESKIEIKYTELVTLLKVDYLRSLEAKRGAALAAAAEMGGTAAELAELEEGGIEVSTQLGEVFSQKKR